MINSKKSALLAIAATFGVLTPLSMPIPETTSSAKSTARVSSLNLLDSAVTGAGTWTTIMESSLKTSNQKDIFVDVSLEAGLITKTLVRSKGGNKDTSTAEAGIKVRVLIDGLEAEPGEVIFARRYQEMSAVFQGLIDDAFYVDELGNIVLDESLVEDEELELLLDTTAAASFNFIQPNLSQGMHDIKVQACIDTNVTSETGAAEAYGMIGKGSITVDEARAVKSDEIVM